MEVNTCRQDQPFEIVVQSEQYNPQDCTSDSSPTSSGMAETEEEMVRIAIDKVAVDSDSNPSCSKDLMPGKLNNCFIYFRTISQHKSGTSTYILPFCKVTYKKKKKNYRALCFIYNFN